jgi:hypothetical protein
MGQLTNLYVSESYQGLIKLADSTTGVTGTLQYTQDGVGNNLPIQISSTQVNITGSFTVNGVAFSGGTNGTSGTSGANGTSGSSGSSGTNGVSGSAGSSGSSGSSGTNGVTGSSGSAGTSGSSGTDGVSGSSGSSGSSGVSFTWKGAWDGNLPYNENDVVEYNGSSYICILTHPATPSFPPPSNPTDWSLLAQAGTSGSSGSSGSSGTNGIAGTNGSAGTSGVSPTFDSGSYATTGSNLFNGTQTIQSGSLDIRQNQINLQTGSFLRLYGVPDLSGNGPAAIQFYSSSQATRWINMQPVPGPGDLAFSDFPSNNHFMFLKLATHTIEFEAPLTATGSAPILINSGLNVSSTLIQSSSFIHTGSIFQQGNVFLKPDSMSAFTTDFVTQSIANQASNIIGINANNAQFTGSVQISGSNNILLQAQRTTTPAGSQGIVSGSNNIITAGIPTLQSGSISIPGFNNNIGTSTPTITTNFSGIVSTTVNANIGNLAFTVNSNSGSTNVTQNNIQGTLTVTNNVSSSFASQTSLNVLRNVINGNGHTISLSGSTVGAGGTSKVVNDNIIGGNTNTVFSSTNDNTGSLTSTLIYGNNLIVSASNTTSGIIAGGLGGSAFVGRYNDATNTLANNHQTVFAVGTGTGTAARRTSLLVSGSGLTVVRNGLDVSGSLGVTGSLAVTGSLRVGGNLQFNGAQYSSLQTLSGSANVSQSVYFDTTGPQFGVSLVDNTKLTVANSGTYNIQFSAQLLADTGADNTHIWFKKNGTNIAGSATQIALANNAENVITVNILDTAVSNDYYEIAWQSANGDAVLLYEAATGNIPSVPSVITTITQVR